MGPWGTTAKFLGIAVTQFCSEVVIQLNRPVTAIAFFIRVTASPLRHVYSMFIPIDWEFPICC